MRVWILLLIVLGVAAPAVAAGQSPQRTGASADEPQSQPLNATPDFLFGRPRGSIGIRGSWLVGRASSDFTTSSRTN